MWIIVPLEEPQRQQVSGVEQLKLCMTDGHLYHLVVTLNPVSWCLVAKENLWVKAKHFSQSEGGIE